MATYVEVWTWKAPVQAAVEPLDLTGYDVEAADGHIGKIDEASKQTGNSSIVVDTGWWIFGFMPRMKRRTSVATKPK